MSWLTNKQPSRRGLIGISLVVWLMGGCTQEVVLGRTGNGGTLLNLPSESGGTDTGDVVETMDTTIGDSGSMMGEPVLSDEPTGVEAASDTASGASYSMTCDGAVEYEIDTGLINSPACQLKISALLPAETEVDPVATNLVYGNGEGVGIGARKVFSFLPDSSYCEEGVLAWMFDKMTEPEKIVLCPDTCLQVIEGINSPVRLELGCTTALFGVETGVSAIKQR